MVPFGRELARIYDANPFGAWLSLGLTSINLPFRINESNLYTTHSFHAGGVQMAMCDGSVHFVNERITEETLVAIFSRDGGEPVDPKDWAR